jgi:NhaA family Na+:H+ antiporter
MLVGRKVKTWMYALGGVALWFFLLTGGVNADVAGVVAAMAIPGNSPAPEKTDAHAKYGTKVSLLDHLIHGLHPWSALLIMPLFALANTAVPIDLSSLSSLTSKPIAVGIILGLVIGKPIGITAFTLASIKSGIATMPEGCTTKHLIVLGLLGGIGFTMCLFLTALALGSNPAAMNLGKLAIIVASAIAAIAGMAIMSTFADVNPEPNTAPAAIPATA